MRKSEQLRVANQTAFVRLDNPTSSFPHCGYVVSSCTGENKIASCQGKPSVNGAEGSEATESEVRVSAANGISNYDIV